MARAVFAVALAALAASAAVAFARADDATERFVDGEIDKLGTSLDEMSPFRRVVDAVVSVTVSGARSTDELLRNSSVFGDNALWRGLITECGGSASLSCVKRNVFDYLDRTVSSVGDVPITDSLVFERNQRVFENKYERSKNEAREEGGAEEGDEGDEGAQQGRSFSTFVGVADALMDKGERFLQSHDLRLQLPGVLLDGAVLRLSPRALTEGGGALLTVEPAPAADARILFNKHKKMFRRKLLLGLFALLLVIKLIKVAVMFLLPVLLGVGTAKKILLKVLLFIFPALTHLFKFCSYYHGLHASKYHHHHHQVAHHHHHVPVHVPVPVHLHHDHHDHHDHHLDDSGPTIYASAPGPSYHSGPPAGPWGPHDYTSRSEHLAAAQHNENELASWGLGGGPGGIARDTFGIADNSLAAHQLAYSAYSYLDDQRVSRSAQPVTEPTKVFPAPSKSSSAAAASVPATAIGGQQFRPAAAQQFLQFVQPQAKKDHQVATASASMAVANGAVDHAALLRAQHQLLLRQQQLQQQKQLQQQQLQQLQQQQLKQQLALRIQVVTPTPITGTTVQVTYDPFYSPILQRMDNVFVQLGFNEEACRERLVCSMYKNPPRFSPHSNLISNELSRDASELQKPAVQNSAVTRFHRYVQAARDGQDQKDCLRLYPACTVNTEL